jgi:hypothetical protein
MSTFKIIPFTEIRDNLNRQMLEEIYQAFSEGATFEIGVDKTKFGFRLTVNCRPWGIYLHTDATDLIKQYTEPYGNEPECIAVITPDRQRSGTIVGEDWKEVIIYVSPEEFSQFNLDTQIVFNLYSSESLCFRGIPDTWFSKLALIQFIHDKLLPHPLMVPWFASLRLSATTMWLSPPLIR